jgi:hypothetical protein
MRKAYRQHSRKATITVKQKGFRQQPVDLRVQGFPAKVSGILDKGSSDDKGFSKMIFP